METNLTILAKVENALQETMEEKKETLKEIAKYEESENKDLHTQEFGVLTSRPFNLSMLYGKQEVEDMRIKTLRLIKSELSKANTTAVYSLDENQETAVLLKMTTQREETAKEYRKLERTDLANIEEDELAIIKEFTPAQPTEDDIKAFVSEAIDKYLSEQPEGYKLSIKDMGKIMPVVKAKFPNVKGNIVSEVLNRKM